MTLDPLYGLFNEEHRGVIEGDDESPWQGLEGGSQVITGSGSKQEALRASAYSKGSNTVWRTYNGGEKEYKSDGEENEASEWAPPGKQYLTEFELVLQKFY